MTGAGFAHSEIANSPPKTTPKTTPAYTQIFKENIQAAVRNHPRVAAAIATRDSYRYQQREVESGLYPTLEVGVSGRTRLAQSFENRFDNITLRSLRNTSANANITGRQLIYDAGRISGRVASAHHTFTAAHEEYSRIASAIALLAAENHFQIILQRARRTLHQEDIRQIIPDDLRHNMAVLLQDVVLFSGSIKENIAMGQPDISDADM